jgi:ribosomal protein S6
MKKELKTKLRIRREVVRVLQLKEVRQVNGASQNPCQPQSTDSQNVCCA